MVAAVNAHLLERNIPGAKQHAEELRRRQRAKLGEANVIQALAMFDLFHDYPITGTRSVRSIFAGTR